MVCSVFPYWELGVCVHATIGLCMQLCMGPDCASICGEREESKQKTKKWSYSCEIDAIGTYSTLPTMVAKMI